jgi:hypothetical protein
LDRKLSFKALPLLIAIFLLLSSCGSFALFHGGRNTVAFSPLQPTSLNQSTIEIGYSPNSLAPITQQIPIFTANDELWVKSNYNNGIPTVVTLTNQTSGYTVASNNVPPQTISEIYSFPINLATQNFTLLVTTPSNNSQYTIEFINPVNSSINSLTGSYSLNNATLSISLVSPNLADKFDIQQCLTRTLSAATAQIPLPSSLGTGFIGVIGDPNTTSAMVETNGSNPASPFSFSFELLANYTSVLSGASGGIGYTSSEVEAASSNSLLIQSSGPSSANATLMDFAPLRTGRYTLQATFQSETGGIQQVDTPLLIESPLASSWYWLGSCDEFGSVSPSFTSQISLAGSPTLWPKYLYLMYRIVPGIESFSNITLGLQLDRVRFVNGNNKLPSNIGVSLASDPSGSKVEFHEVENGGVAYLIINGTYPVVSTFDLSFAGKVFSSVNVNFQSANIEVVENIALAELQVSVTQGGVGLSNRTVTILSNSLNASYTTLTNANGVVQVFVPPGQYTIYVKNGNDQSSPTTESFVAGNMYSVPFSFPVPANYTTYLIWIVSIVTVAGAIGNLWFWLARRRVRRQLRDL